MADRGEIEAFWERWLEANRLCEEKRDWGPLADFYADDATYGWNCGPKDEFMALGREQIRELARGLEMLGLEGRSYPYQVTMIDGRQGLVIGFWKQVSERTRDDGTPYVVPGLGASWFGRADGLNAGALFLEMATDRP